MADTTVSSAYRDDYPLAKDFKVSNNHRDETVGSPFSAAFRKFPTAALFWLDFYYH
jgi:hypothetical protein